MTIHRPLASQAILRQPLAARWASLDVSRYYPGNIGASSGTPLGISADLVNDDDFLPTQVIRMSFRVKFVQGSSESPYVMSVLAIDLQDSTKLLFLPMLRR
jgi:hypothetical protein